MVLYGTVRRTLATVLGKTDMLCEAVGWWRGYSASTNAATRAPSTRFASQTPSHTCVPHSCALLPPQACMRSEGFLEVVTVETDHRHRAVMGIKPQ